MQLNTLHVPTLDLTAYAFMRPWFRLLRQEGHRVTLATTVTRFRSELEPVTDEIVHVPMARNIRPWEDLRAVLELARVMRRIRPDVVHSHTSKAGMICRVAARLAGVPLILHTIHDLPENAARNPLVKWVYHALEKAAAPLAHHLLTVSYANQEQILSGGIGSPERLTVVRGGIDLAQYVPARTPAEIRAEWKIPEGAILIGTTGRLERAKGQAYLLEAFQELLRSRPEAFLVVMGTGVLEDQLKQRARELDVYHRTLFTGWQEDLVSGMNALDLFVLPSLYEGLGVVLLEAMALGKACVSTLCGGTRDVIVPGETGLFAPVGDSPALARAILELLRDPARCRAMGEAGRARVEREFRTELGDRQRLNLYLQLARQRRVGTA